MIIIILENDETVFYFNLLYNLNLLKCNFNTYKKQAIYYNLGVEAARLKEAMVHQNAQRQQLAKDQSAHDGDAERPAQFLAGARTQSQRHAAEQGRHGGHDDRAEAQQAGLIDRL